MIIVVHLTLNLQISLGHFTLSFQLMEQIKIKPVVTETTGVCDVTLHLLRYTLIRFAIHRSIFPNRSGR